MYGKIASTYERMPKSAKVHFPQRPPITFALNHFPEGYPFHCVELGVLEGDHSFEMLSVLQPDKLWLVDMWTDIKVSGSGSDYLGNDQEDWDRRYLKVVERYAPYANVSVLRLAGQQAARILPNDLDLVYIDACHDYECVLEDMRDWLPKLKVGGVLSGDDYSREEVVAAVADFLKDYPSYKLYTCPTQWWFVKE